MSKDLPMIRNPDLFGTVDGLPEFGILIPTPIGRWLKFMAEKKGVDVEDYSLRLLARSVANDIEEMSDNADDIVDFYQGFGRRFPGVAIELKELGEVTVQLRLKESKAGPDRGKERTFSVFDKAVDEYNSKH